ncbi:MAG TPA: hypothetical protein VIJ14_07865, partial [Rhabdochlamydiaceae bacterium]
KSLPCFWSALKDLRHLHLIHCIGHFAKGAIMMIVAGSLAHFDAGAKNLASRRRWVEMEDYVTNYPVEVKQNILSAYGKQLVFYISALLPQTRLARRISARIFESNQFQPENIKFSILQSYFSNPNPRMRQWPLAIHQFQQLPVENQITLGPQLNALLQNLSEAERVALPDDVKAVMLNETVKSYASIPTYQEAAFNQWQAVIAVFEKLPGEQQSVLGQELFRLIQTVPRESIHFIFPETMRLAVLKAMSRDADTYHDIPKRTFANAIFDGLYIPAVKAEFGVYLHRLIENNTLDINQLSPQMQAVLPGNE